MRRRLTGACGSTRLMCSVSGPTLCLLDTSLARPAQSVLARVRCTPRPLFVQTILFKYTNALQKKIKLENKEKSIASCSAKSINSLVL